MKKNIIIIVTSIIILLSVSIVNNTKLKEYETNMFYMDTYINVKLYAKNKKLADTMFKNADEIYAKYQKLTNAYNKDSLIYYINNNTSTDEFITLDEDIYKMLKLSLEWQEKSNNKFNVNIGKIIKIWKDYRENNNGIPNINELKKEYNSINKLVLLDDNKILNNHPSIDLGAVVKGYATEEVSNMLKNNNIKNFIINAGGNVEVGTKYKKEYYRIGIEDPTNKGNVYQIVKGNNISVVTSGGYERFYEYEGIKYHHIIDPDTLYPANNMLSVTVITNNSALADILSTTLFLLPVEDSLKLVNSLDNVEAIFYIDKDNIIKSEGFSKYE